MHVDYIHYKRGCKYQHQDKLGDEKVASILLPLELEDSLNTFNFEYWNVIFSNFFNKVKKFGRQLFWIDCILLSVWNFKREIISEIDNEEVIMCCFFVSPEACQHVLLFIKHCLFYLIAVILNINDRAIFLRWNEHRLVVLEVLYFFVVFWSHNSLKCSGTVEEKFRVYSKSV